MKSKLLLLICLLLILNYNSVFGQVGDPAPNFTVTDTKGNNHTLYDYLDNGKKVLLDFFFTTCIPCQYYSPQVNLAYKKYGCNEGDVIFMSIDLNNSNAEVIAYEEEYKIEFPSISGDEGGGNAVINQYNVNSFPRFYLIDSTHKIIDVIDPPTLQVFDFRFGMHNLVPMECNVFTQDVNTISGFKLFPNPVKDHISISFNNYPDEQRIWDFKIFNCFGQLLLNGRLNSNSLDVSQISRGLYFLELSSEGNTYTTKILLNN